MNKVQEVSKGYGLDIRQIEPDVYQVKNNDKVVNIDNLKRDIGNCFLVIGCSRKRDKDEQGFSYLLSNVYYITLGLNNTKAVSLLSQLRDKKINVVVSRYTPDANAGFDVGTIYSAEELGRV